MEHFAIHEEADGKSLTIICLYCGQILEGVPALEEEMQIPFIHKRECPLLALVGKES